MIARSNLIEDGDDMANEQNLKPKTTLSKEEAKRIGSKGGIASGKARRERKAMKEQLEILLNMPVTDSKVKNKIKKMGVEEDDMNNQMAITTALYLEALSGNTKAYELIRDTIGEKPIDKIENITPPVINIQRPKE